MKALLFIYRIFMKFPLLFIASITLSVILGILTASSLLAIGPIVDFFIHPDLKGVSPLTVRALDILKILGMAVTLRNWVILFLAIILLASAFQILAKYFILKTRYMVVRDIMLGTFEDFFNAKWYFFTSGKQGEFINTFIREINIVGQAFGAMSTFFATLLQAVFYLAIPLCLSWQVTVISLGIALFFTAPFILFSSLSYRLGRLNTVTANRMSSVIHENLSLAKVLLGYNNQKKGLDNFRDAFDANRDTSIKSLIVNESIPALYRPFAMITVVIAFFSAPRFGVPLSEITVLLLALLQVGISIGNLTMQKNSLYNFFPSYEQVNTLRKRAKELKQTSGTKLFDRFDHELLIEDLSFSYPQQGLVLRGINARIPKGSMVAFVGESGTGKSTLIDMVMGFNDPESGRIIFDGVDLRDFDMRSYRRKVGYVPQDSVLFNMSVRDNLLWAHESATDSEIVEACRLANADDFIRELPGGYNTIVGDRGVRLSGGQVQRIALARAILRKPELLILDEATSSLDSHSERLIQEAIEAIAKEVTVIVVAHRLSTIVNTDYIYVFKNGRIVEEGRYNDLVAKDGYFNHMVNLQVLERKSVNT